MRLIQYMGRVSSLILFTLFISSVLTLDASGQAGKTATRSAEYDLFGGFSDVKSDYLSSDHNHGGTIGADYTQFVPRYRGLIVPSIEVRGTFAPGPVVGEKTFEVGARLATSYRRLHPYVDLLVGGGFITFDHPTISPSGRLYKSDRSFIYVYGGGVTYDTNTNFSVLVDYQQQYWNLDEHPPVRFYPGALTFGVVYHIPFKAYKTH